MRHEHHHEMFIWRQANACAKQLYVQLGSGFGRGRFPVVPISARESWGRANGEMNKGDYDVAIADYTKAIESDPTLPTPYINRGLARQAKGDVDGALADDDKAIELNPTMPQLPQSRPRQDGQTRLRRGDRRSHYSDRIESEFCRGLLQSQPCRAGQGRCRRALADHNKAIKLAPALGNLP